MLDLLVQWVEQGVAPDSVVANARGAGNAAGANPELPAGWAVDRSRPLCPCPKVARDSGSGSLDDAANVVCQ